MITVTEFAFRAYGSICVAVGIVGGVGIAYLGIWLRKGAR